MFLLKIGCYNSSTAICAVKINDFPEYIFTDKNDTFTVNTTNSNLSIQSSVNPVFSGHIAY